MPRDGETSRRSSASSLPDQQASDEPCSVRDALLSSLKRESPEMPEAPADPVSTEPERKRRRRRGIRDKAVQLNDDLMGLILPHLAKVSVKHLFILSMVNHELRTAILTSHDLWEQLYRSWERKLCQSRPHLNRSMGSDFAARCFQAMPKWMVKHTPHLGISSAFRSRMHPAMPPPYVQPVVGNDWRTAGVPNEMRPSFERFARKVLCLWNIGCCGCCGTRQGKQRAIWTLNMRVCRGCWLERIVSNRTLMQVWRESWRARVECDYGIDLLKPLVEGGPRLLELIRNKVFYIRNFMPPSAREKYTQALADFPDNKTCVPIWLFWRPHLEKIVDLAARRVEYQAKREAGAVLACVFRRRYALGLRDHYEDKQRNVQIKRVCQLRHNEIRRQREPTDYLDPIEDWRHAHQRQMLIDYADLLPVPDEFPLKYIEPAPA